MVLSVVSDGAMRGLDSLGSGLTSPFFEPTLRLGVTGLARAGKTVFITSLVANLLNRGGCCSLQRRDLDVWKVRFCSRNLI